MMQLKGKEIQIIANILKIKKTCILNTNFKKYKKCKESILKTIIKSHLDSKIETKEQ